MIVLSFTAMTGRREPWAALVNASSSACSRRVANDRSRSSIAPDISCTNGIISGLASSAVADKGHGALESARQRVDDRRPVAGVVDESLGEMFGAADVHRPPLLDHRPQTVRSADILDQRESWRGVRPVHHPQKLRISCPPVEDSSVLVRKEDRGAGRFQALGEAIEYRIGGLRQPPSQVEFGRVRERGDVGVSATQGRTAPRREDLVADRTRWLLPMQELLTSEHDRVRDILESRRQDPSPLGVPGLPVCLTL